MFNSTQQNPLPANRYRFSLLTPFSVVSNPLKFVVTVQCLWLFWRTPARPENKSLDIQNMKGLSVMKAKALGSVAMSSGSTPCRNIQQCPNPLHPINNSFSLLRSVLPRVPNARFPNHQLLFDLSNLLPYIPPHFPTFILPSKSNH